MSDKRTQVDLTSYQSIEIDYTVNDEGFNIVLRRFGGHRSPDLETNFPGT